MVSTGIKSSCMLKECIRHSVQPSNFKVGKGIGFKIISNAIISNTRNQYFILRAETSFTYNNNSEINSQVNVTCSRGLSEVDPKNIDIIKPEFIFKKNLFTTGACSEKPENVITKNKNFIQVETGHIPKVMKWLNWEQEVELPRTKPNVLLAKTEVVLGSHVFVYAD